MLQYYVKLHFTCAAVAQQNRIRLCQLILQTTLGVLKFHFSIFLIYIIRTLILDHTRLAKFLPL
jgi:hypothetical protein